MAFQDGLGERKLAKDQAGAPLELLCLRRELSVVPSFEFALRERASRLSSFRHPSFGRVRAIERTGTASQTLTVVADEIPGIRLSELLDAAQARPFPIHTAAALGLIRQLASSVAMLHETVRDAAHGALAPERLILGPNARLVVVDHVLGSALEQLLFSRERYWTELRVALPRVAGLPRFDHLTDVTQLGVVALSLILGRRLQDDEYPGKIAALVSSATATSSQGDSSPLSPVLKTWLERALQLDPRASFPSAVDARTALENAIAESGFDTPLHSIERVIARFQGKTPDPTGSMPIPVATAATAAAPAPADVPSPAPVGAAAPVAAPAPVSAAATTFTPIPVEIAAPAAVSVRPAPIASAPVVTPPLVSAPILSAPTVSAPTGFAPAAAAPQSPVPVSVNPVLMPPMPAPAPATKAPVVEIPSPAMSTPAPAVRSPEPAAVTAPPPPAAVAAPIVPVEPKTGSLPAFRDDEEPVPTALAFEASTRGGSSRWMLTAAAIAGVVALGGYAAWAGMKGGTAAAPVAAKPAETTGTLVISTEPSGAHASVDGSDRGTTPLTLTLPAGAHTVRLRGAYGDERSIAVAIVAGSSVAQYVDLAKEAPAAPAAAAPVAAPVAPAVAAGEEVPAAGWITLRSRFDVTVFEKGQLLGNSQTEKIMIPAGKHEFELVSDSVGYRATKSVQVAQGKVATVTIDAPTGSLAVNAQPWADVWVDGEKVGETPIGNLTLPIGSHEVIFRHPDLGEQHQTALVTLKGPARISADLRKK